MKLEESDTVAEIFCFVNTLETGYCAAFYIEMQNFFHLLSEAVRIY